MRSLLSEEPERLRVTPAKVRPVRCVLTISVPYARNYGKLADRWSICYLQLRRDGAGMILPLLDRIQREYERIIAYFSTFRSISRFGSRRGEDLWRRNLLYTKARGSSVGESSVACTPYCKLLVGISHPDQPILLPSAPPGSVDCYEMSLY